MKKATLRVPLTSKAYQVFLEEIGRYRKRVLTVLAVPDLGSKDLRIELTALFHTVKGGAGFFGLDDLADTSAELERMFALEPFPEQANTFELLNRFADITGHMPNPM